MHSIDSHRPLFLVVDDAPESIEPIVDCLHHADFRTRIATNGERALRLASSTPVPESMWSGLKIPPAVVTSTSRPARVTRMRRRFSALDGDALK